MKALPISEKSYQYVLNHTESPTEVMQQLRDVTAALPGAGMQIAVDQGQFMALQVKLMQARRIVEIGCFTGYSAISMASALPPGGKLVSLDVSEEYTRIARKYFALAAVQERIDLRLAPALETLPLLKVEFGYGSFDMAFVDADKENILAYYEHCLDLLRPGGLILVDNVLWSGLVLDDVDQSASTVALRQFNDMVIDDPRVEKVMLHIADGLYFIRKK